MVRGRQIKSQPSVKLGVMAGPICSYHQTGTLRLHCEYVDATLQLQETLLHCQLHYKILR